VKKHVCNLPLDVSARIGYSDNNVIDVMVVFQSCGFVDVVGHTRTYSRKKDPTINSAHSLRMMSFPCAALFICRILIVLVFLFLFALSANECFGADDGYSAFDPAVAANSKLGKAVRDFLSPDPAVSEPVKEMYGATINSWCVGLVSGMNYIFYNLRSFNEEVGGWDVGSVTTMAGMVRYFSIV
jgi:surface protein